MHLNSLTFQGRPFRESLRENRPLYMSLSGLFLFSIFCASEVSKEFNETIELISFPMDLRNKLVTAILLDFGLAFAVEYVAKYLFANNVPSKALKLDDVKTWKPMRIAGFGKVPDPEKPIKMPKFKFNK
jgi:manganese-transporting P-type ATPase